MRGVTAKGMVEPARPMTAVTGQSAQRHRSTFHDPNQTPDAQRPMKWLTADNPVRAVRTIFRELLHTQKGPGQECRHLLTGHLGGRAVVAVTTSLSDAQFDQFLDVTTRPGAG